MKPNLNRFPPDFRVSFHSHRITVSPHGPSALCTPEKLTFEHFQSSPVPRINQQPISQTLSRHDVTTVTCGVHPHTAQVRWLFNGRPLDLRRHPGLEMVGSGLRFLPLLDGLQGEDLWEKELERAVRMGSRGRGERSSEEAEAGDIGEGRGRDRPGNHGEYRCTATTSAGSVVSQPAVLSLPVLDPFPSGEDLSLEIPEGGYATLPCHKPYSLPEAELFIVGPGGPVLEGRFPGVMARHCCIFRQALYVSSHYLPRLCVYNDGGISPFLLSKVKP
ncbi:cell adhesion molecule-related/down-regulated by oncogenes [Plakobranchus ocellatus]|uniref:Cell adhesion molecule-related/down-regulated by oncogenes n=1 Tax=Plakobranchus ocellatus TaxID=259542 RepID=A0AAV4AX80_9GAST|nr:cell adhesion molecule-related/down-regulated by oncogenes [Plakobranchus ocellatus]